MKNVLIIDDEEDIAGLIAGRLRASGYGTVIAGNGLEALERLRESAADVILLDLSMPHMDGIEFYRRICNEDGKPRYPVIVVTARANLAAIFKGLYLDGLILKPFQSDYLLNEISIVLRRQYWRKSDGATRKVMVVDSDRRSLGEIADAFVNAKYETRAYSNGASCIEKVILDPPDIMVVNLALNDIPGDLLILRLNYMAKTKGVNFLLYVARNDQHDKIVLENLSHKTGVKYLCEYDHPQGIVDAVTEVIAESEAK